MAASSPIVKERSRFVLAFIAVYVDEQGFAPSIREIADALGGVSKSAVARCLDALEASGSLTRSPSKHRALRIARAA